VGALGTVNFQGTAQTRTDGANNFHFTSVTIHDGGNVYLKGTGSVLSAIGTAGAPVTTTVNALIGSASTTEGQDLVEAITDGTQTVAAGSISTSGTGTGLALSYTALGGEITGITVTTSGVGYHVGDTVTIAAAGGVAMPGRSTDAVFILALDDLVMKTSVLTTKDALLGSVPSADLVFSLVAKADEAVPAASISTNGDGKGIALKYTSTNAEVTSITVTAGGSGYAVGNTITVAAAALAGGSSAITFTLVSDDMAEGSITVGGEAGSPASVLGVVGVNVIATNVCNVGVTGSIVGGTCTS
jgi:hypothetical protein